MSRLIERALAVLALALKQPLTAYCELDTADIKAGALISDVGDYQTYIRLSGMGTMLTSDQVAAGAEQLREGIASSLKRTGHVIQACFTYDPDRSASHIRRHVQTTRNVARALGMHMDDLLEEREQIWGERMAWEESSMALWTRRSVLTREARRDDLREQRRSLKWAPELGDAQSVWRAGGLVAQEHRGFVDAAVTALRNLGVRVETPSPAAAVAAMREAVYPETADTSWRPHLPGDPVMLRVNETPRPPNSLFGRREDASTVIAEPIADQFFRDDAVVLGARQVRIGDRDWTGIDMRTGPETPRAFVELLRVLRLSRTPFRIAFLIEGADDSLMATKRAAAALLSAVSPVNRRIYEQLEYLREMEQDSAVKLRVSLATWAPSGESALLRGRAASLASALESWGVCQASVLAGDPLEAVMSSAPGLAIASTAPVHAAPLAKALMMLPWNRPGSPWAEGSLLFSTAEGVPFPYDPMGSLRQSMFTLIFGEPGHGKSVLSNTINLGLILSGAALTSAGARLPLVGVLDIGVSARGLILLIQTALPADRKHEASYIRFKNSLDYSVNPFDTQLGCREPLPLEVAFLQNLLSLACTPTGTHKPFEGMDGLIAATITELYRMVSDGGDNASPKRYNADVAPDVAAALRRHRIELCPEALWWDVVDALCNVREYRMAGLAQRYAVPVLADLIEAVRATHIVHQFGEVRAVSGESLIQTFQRYVTGLIEWLPNLSRPTVFDTGLARVIVLDLEEVALNGSDKDDRQTEVMYIMGHHILARNMFLRPGYVRLVPDRVRDYHRRRFNEIYETIKRLALDETHRANGAPRVMDLILRSRREGRKHRVQISMSSQLLRDFPQKLVDQATEVFVLGAGNEETNIETAQVFRLSEAGSQACRYRLKGPGENGEGAPFLARLSLSSGSVELLLINSLGPREVWALSTRPVDVALRDRLYAAIGHVESWRRLATIFRNGTAQKEIERRVADLTRRGIDENNAQALVVDALAQELLDGRGIGLALLKRSA